MRISTLFLAVAVTAMVLAVGCANDSIIDSTTQRTTGVALVFGLAGGTDVGGMRFTVSDCDDRVVMVEERSLIDMYLPDDVAFDGDQFDPESMHNFTDLFVSLAPGCYNVRIQPLSPDGQGGWEDSFDCAPAWQEDVIVHGEETTEIVLISQCVGDELGGLDVIAVINREPELVWLEFDPSKFVADCEGIIVCATATDPDCDPLELVWSQTSGDPVPISPVVRWREDCDVTECMRLMPDEVGSYEFMVTAYDLLISGSQWMRIEDWLAAHGYPNDSHASLSFPLYSGVECVEPPDCCECGCTRTQGYWKNHHKYAPNPSQNIPWPAPMDEDNQACGDTILGLLNTPPAGGDAWLILAHQFIAAWLNVAAGAFVPLEVQEALDAAAGYLVGACIIHLEDRPFALAVAAMLDDYNSGVIGPGHCDVVPGIDI